MLSSVITKPLHCEDASGFKKCAIQKFQTFLKHYFITMTIHDGHTLNRIDHLRLLKQNVYSNFDFSWPQARSLEVMTLGQLF